MVRPPCDPSTFSPATSSPSASADSLRRAIVETDAGDGVRVTRNGRTAAVLLQQRLSQPQPASGGEAAAAAAAIEQYGAGAGASRLVTGSHPLYAELEARLARLKGSDAACVFGSGYLANTGIIPALAGRGDLILIDELAHACMHAGARAERRSPCRSGTTMSAMLSNRCWTRERRHSAMR